MESKEILRIDAEKMRIKILVGLGQIGISQAKLRRIKWKYYPVLGGITFIGH